MNEWGDHRHYYDDPSGGFGWPSCVICGKPVDAEPSPAVRNAVVLACCGNTIDVGHTSACTSIDAWQKREAARG